MAKTRIREYGEQKSQRFTLHLTAALIRNVRRIAAKEDRSQASVVRAAVVRYIGATDSK